MMFQSSLYLSPDSGVGWTVVPARRKKRPGWNIRAMAIEVFSPVTKKRENVMEGNSNCRVIETVMLQLSRPIPSMNRIRRMEISLRFERS